MFAETLKRLRIKSGKSRYKLAQYSELSEPYILRLESGERANPSRDVVVRLGMALAHGVSSIEIWDMDALALRRLRAPTPKGRGRRCRFRRRRSRGFFSIGLISWPQPYRRLLLVLG